MTRAPILRSVAFIFFCAGLTTLADAAQIGPSTGAQTTMDLLKKQGYKCETLGVGSSVCTKEGSPDYYCSAGICHTLKKSLSPRAIIPKFKTRPLKVDPG